MLNPQEYLQSGTDPKQKSEYGYLVLLVPSLHQKSPRGTLYYLVNIV